VPKQGDPIKVEFVVKFFFKNFSTIIIQDNYLYLFIGVESKTKNTPETSSQK